MITKRGAFPLHMTPFESYMFVDDRPRYPMTFVVQFEMSGNLDREAFQTAFDQGLLRHPMLRSIIRPAKSARDCWVSAPEYDSQVDFGSLSDEILVDGAGEYIDLRQEIGIRCWCRNDQETAFLTFVFHHSTCDGIGAYQFLGDLLWYYAAQTSPSGDADQFEELAELPEMNLRKRIKANLGLDLMKFPSDDSQDWSNHIAQPLVPRFPESVTLGTANLFPNFHTRTYEKNDYRKLRLAAQDRGQTVNDRLLHSLFVASCSWNESYGEKSNLPFCVNMPMDLRQTDQPPFSAINLVTNALLLRTNEQINNRDELDISLRQETVRLKHSRFHSEFMQRLVESPQDKQKAMEKFDFDNCHTTVVFSNTGDPTRRFLVELPREGGKVRCGNLLLEDINGVPPMRSQTRATISIFTYRRRLRICLRCDPQHFTTEDGRAFLDNFVHHFEDGSL